MAKGAMFWVEIVCGECAATRQGEFVRSRIPVNELKRVARHEGWTLLENGDWWCPACTKAAIAPYQQPTQRAEGE